MDLKKKLENMLEKHTRKAFVSCDEACMCWEIEALLCDLDMKAENLPNKACSRRVPRRGAKVVKSKSKVRVGRTRG